MKYLFIYLGFYVAFNTVQVISRRVVGRAEETSTYSLLGFCTVNCRPTASNYQLSHLRLYWESNPGLRGGKGECYHSATVAPGRAEETSTYSSLGFCTVNCWPTASNYQLSHLRPCRRSNPGLRGGRRECYHSATIAPQMWSSVSTCLHF